MSERAFTDTSFHAFLGEEKLMGSRCLSCDAVHLPPRPFCPLCYGEEMAWVEMDGVGKLVAYTTVHIAPTAMIEAGYDRKNPYCVGIVELENGSRISAQILGVDATRPDAIAVDTPLRATFVERGERTYLAFSIEM
jgi:uncharacterized OB-fold protein